MAFIWIITCVNVVIKRRLIFTIHCSPGRDGAIRPSDFSLVWIIGWTKPTRSCMVKLKIRRRRMPPPPPPTRVVLYVDATVCPQPSSPSCLCVRVSEPKASGWLLAFYLYPASNGSGTSEDLFWKLDALQTFIRDLHWPEEEFGKHLEQRLKLMASDMIESCVKR